MPGLRALLYPLHSEWYDTFRQKQPLHDVEMIKIVLFYYDVIEKD